MYKKKLIALSLAALIPVSLPLLAEQETENEPAAASAATQPAEPAATDAAAADTQSGVQTDAAVTDSDSSTPPAAHAPSLADRDARWQRRNQHYEDLKKRAEALGVILPEKPPWETPRALQTLRPSMEERMKQREKMMSMSPEEVTAMRKQHYEEMRERAKASGVDLPASPPWEREQKTMDDEWTKRQQVIQGMTDEQRAACQAMHRRQMGMRDAQSRPMMPSQGMAPGMGRGMGPGMMGPGMGRGMEPGMMGPGYGYGPSPYGYGPAPYDGQQNFWNPNR
jgi:hypothetical protein